MRTRPGVSSQRGGHRGWADRGQGRWPISLSGEDYRRNTRTRYANRTRV